MAFGGVVFKLKLIGHGRHNVTRRRTKTDSLRNLSDSGDRNIFGILYTLLKKR